MIEFREDEAGNIIVYRDDEPVKVIDLRPIYRGWIFPPLPLLEEDPSDA